MANELQISTFETGQTLYVVIRKPNGQVWNTSGGIFEAYTTAELAAGNLSISLTEQGTASRTYAGTFPAAIADSVPGAPYLVSVYDRAGGSPAETDVLVGTGDIAWGVDSSFVTTAQVNSECDTAISEAALATAAALSTAQADLNIITGAAGVILDGTPDVNAAQISGDAVAADNLETMLDGTGGKLLTLRGVIVTATGNDNAVLLDGLGSGEGLKCRGGLNGHGISAVGGSGAAGFGLRVIEGIEVTGPTSGAGISITGGSGSSGHGIKIGGGVGGDADGILITGTGAGKDINATEINDIQGTTFDSATDSLEAIRDRGDAAWTTGATNVTLGAVQTTVEAGNRVSAPVLLEMWQDEAKTFTLTIQDTNGDPVDLSGMTLRFVVANELNPPVGKFQVDEPTLFVSGTSDEVANVPVSAVQAATANEHWRWWLWNVTTNAVLSNGPFKILPARDEVP